MHAAPPLRLHVRLTPRGGRDAIDGWATDSDGRPYLKVRVAAPPVDGEANAALEKTMTKALGRFGARVRIVAGDCARLKQVEIGGISIADLHQILGSPPDSNDGPSRLTRAGGADERAPCVGRGIRRRARE